MKCCKVARNYCDQAHAEISVNWRRALSILDLKFYRQFFFTCAARRTLTLSDFNNLR